MKQFTSVLFLILGLHFSNFNLFSQTTINAGNVMGHWPLSGSPYLVKGDITVKQDTFLLIDPGVIVNFQGHYKLKVLGRLLASGTSTDTIVFTASNANTGWFGIRFEATVINRDSSIFQFCKVQYGKAN